jgi:hypothetical protein
MLGQFSNKAILRLESDTTAAWAASIFGEFERYEYPVSEVEEGKQSTREELQKRESILPAEFLTIKPTNPENGLTGYYLSPEIGAYRATLPWSFAFEELIRPASPEKCPKFIARNIPPFVADWSEEDRKRLCLKAPSQDGTASNDATQEQDGDKDGATDKPEVAVIRHRDARRQSDT